MFLPLRHLKELGIFTIIIPDEYYSWMVNCLQPIHARDCLDMDLQQERNAARRAWAEEIRGVVLRKEGS